MNMLYTEYYQKFIATYAERGRDKLKDMRLFGQVPNANDTEHLQALIYLMQDKIMELTENRIRVVNYE